MTKPGAINKKKNVYHGNHKSTAKRAARGKAKTLAVTKAMDDTQQRKRLTNPKATVTHSKKKQRLLNKGKKSKDVANNDNTMDGVCSVYIVRQMHTGPASVLALGVSPFRPCRGRSCQ
jgi:hypothetical protein